MDVRTRSRPVWLWVWPASLFLLFHTCNNLMVSSWKMRMWPSVPPLLTTIYLFLSAPFIHGDFESSSWFQPAKQQRQNCRCLKQNRITVGQEMYITINHRSSGSMGQDCKNRCSNTAMRCLYCFQMWRSSFWLYGMHAITICTRHQANPLSSLSSCLFVVQLDTLSSWYLHQATILLWTLCLVCLFVFSPRLYGGHRRCINEPRSSH